MPGQKTAKKQRFGHFAHHPQGVYEQIVPLAGGDGYARVRGV